MTPINNFAALLVGGINSTQTNIPISTHLVNGVTLPAPGMISVDSEVIYYESVSVSGTVQLLGCQRGFDGTAATSHADHARVELRWVARHHNTLADIIHSVLSSLGAGFLTRSNQGLTGNFSNLADKLNKTSPIVVTQSSATWTASHTRNRPVSVELWEADGNELHKFDANIRQEVNASGNSFVYVEEFPETKNGVIILT